MKKSKRDRMTPLLNELYWLPVKFRIEYKIATVNSTTHARLT